MNFVSEAEKNSEKLDLDKVIFLIEISYKSGYSFRCWFRSFEIKRQNCKTKCEWEYASPFFKPILLGVDDIVSVVQLSVKNDDGNYSTKLE